MYSTMIIFMYQSNQYIVNKHAYGNDLTCIVVIECINKVKHNDKLDL